MIMYCILGVLGIWEKGTQKEHLLLKRLKTSGHKPTLKNFAGVHTWISPINVYTLQFSFGCTLLFLHSPLWLLFRQIVHFGAISSTIQFLFCKSIFISLQSSISDELSSLIRNSSAWIYSTKIDWLINRLTDLCAR